MKKKLKNKSVDNNKGKINDETLHLISNESNRKRLQNALNEMNQDIYREHKLIDINGGFELL